MNKQIGVTLTADAAGLQRGLSAAQAATTQFAQQTEASLNKASAATTRYAKSQKEIDAALRGVPAQITDIITSLQGGQRPMTVLLQQGGQLKDMFGGVVPAAQALGSTLVRMINPVTLTVAAVSALGIAWLKGAEEAQRYQQALIMTGNYAGVTIGQISEMASRLGQTAGTTSKAAAALAEIAGSGKIARAAMEDVGRAALELQKTAGQSVGETISEFESLAEAPAAAIVKLNDKYHFLTVSVYEQIRALEEQGRTQDAAALAQQTYATAVRERTDEVKANLGTLQTAWRAVAGVAKEAWDAMLGVGRETTPQERIAEIQKELDQIGGSFFHSARADRLRAQLVGLQDLVRWQNASARAQADEARTQQEGIAAQRELNTLIEKGLSRREQLAKALEENEQRIQRIRAAGGVVTAEQEKAARAAIEKQYKETKSTAPRDDASARLLQQLRQSETVARAQLDTEQKLTKAQQQKLEYERLFADLKVKKVLTADQKNLLQNEAQIRAQLDRNVAVEKELRLKQEMVKVDALRNSLSATLSADSQQYTNQLSVMGLGQRAQDEMRARQKLIDDYQRDLKRASQGYLEGNISNETYQTQLTLLQDNLDARIALQRKYYTELHALQEDWRVGSMSALADYADASRDAASHAQSFFANAFDGMKSALADFALNGKATFGDFANSVINDLARIAIQQSITGPLAGALGGFIGKLFGPLAGVSVSPTLDLGASLGGGAGASFGPMLSLDSGGFTGPGPRNQLAGYVHKGEGVLNQDEIRALGGEAGFNALRQALRGPGHALGGMAGKPRTASAAIPQFTRQTSEPNVYVNIQGAPSQPEQVQARRNQDGSMSIDVVFKQLEDRLAGNMASGRGALSKATQQRFGLRPQLG